MPPFPPLRASNLSSSSAQSVQNKPKKPPKQGNRSGDLHKAPSLGSWFKQILPSNRPERGGTLRPSAFQLQKDLEHVNNNNKSPVPAPRNPPWSASDRGSNLKDVTEVDTVMEDGRKTSWVSGNDVQRRGKRGGDSDKEARTALHGASGNQLNVLDAGGSGSHSSSISDLQYIRAKQEARRLRRNLKESGDYLGVQGFNPETGRLDVITPSDSDMSSLSQETQQKLLVLKNTLKDARHQYKSTREKSEQEAKKILLKSEKERVRRLEKGKERVQEVSQTVTWKRHARQWSSAQEPNLSPIAQSIGETPQASRRESKVCDRAGVAKRASNSSLINFNDSDKQAGGDYAPQQRDRELTKSPDSMATVVRTPKRQSLVDFAEPGTSAWQLFVNGISFDTSEDTEQLHDNKWPKLDAQESPEKAHRMGEVVLEAYSETIPDHMVAQANPESFLGTGSEKKDDPGGNKMHMVALSNTTSRTAKTEVFQQDAPQKCARDTRARRSRTLHCRAHSMEHGNMKLLKGRLLPNAIDKPGIWTRENRPPVAEGRRKMMPNWSHWMRRGTVRFTPIPRTSGPRMVGRLVNQEKEHAVLNLKPDPNPPDSGSSGLDPGLVQHAAPTSRLMLTWGMGLKHPNVDQEPRYKERKETQTPGPGAWDRQHEMTQIRGGKQAQVTKDMTMKSSAQTVTECVSTHITTTTGCDRLCSETSVQAKSEQKKKTKNNNNSSDNINNNRRAQPGDCPEGEGMYKLPRIATSESSLGSSVMRILQKPSSRVKLAQAGDEIGITSNKCKPRRGGRHTQKGDTKPFADTPRAVVSKTVADAPATTGPGTMIKDARVVVDLIAGQGGDMPVGQPQSNPMKETDDVPKGVEKPLQAAAAAAAAAAALSRRDMGIYVVDMMFIQDELTALVQAPGRFPDSNVGGHVPRDRDGQNSPGGRVAARNTGIVVQPEEDGSFGTLLEAAGEFLGLVWCYMLPLWQVYWDRVGPLFDVKSEYWARQNRDEGTTGDCLTVVLALPTSLLLIASYVVALRLGLLCIENCSVVREWAESVYWYFM
ncbi:hypothetical protein E4U54_000265 [Claviceps lovelessii]|nr:hypothetical protein E4U54_000265 [Claviceps lovelessii]